MMKKMLSLGLSLAMVISCCSFNVLATEGSISEIESSESIFIDSIEQYAENLNVNDSDQSPYAVAYLDELSEKQNVQLHLFGEDGSEEVVRSLNSYYRKDYDLADTLRANSVADVTLLKITSIEKSDKIDAMHFLEEIYAEITDDEIKEMIGDYFRRYSNDSGDEKAIAFYNSIFSRANVRSALVDESDVNVDGDKQALETMLTSQTGVTTFSTNSYDDNFSPTAAGLWAYDNYNLYNANFPAFNNGYGSDCTNFVSQALYFGGMQMHDTWYCTKLNDEYPRPSSAEELDYSWALEDPSPWCSVEEFVSFWGAKYKDFYEYTRVDYTENHTTYFYQDPITRGDVVILFETTLWFSVPSHAMIISDYDTTELDFLCAGHAQNRQAHPLLTAISGYSKVQIYCL